MAAWMALDPCDEANGCLLMVPSSHTWETPPSSNLVPQLPLLALCLPDPRSKRYHDDG
ncbi:MAG: hypothetical protein CUN49_02305 [Candidatus Thermofonsia Clade 1 bacterium]|uniref:Uncharacterized protein n=1 Tax=Candidatus Thermofonsia Clade 1 bacterium TaxID=2364210 RepID=A0A2M8PHN1_9CHLR|nr:MAG: hypothetical protein CUN49_02305 [Candidatus Thermofonsia Clade 1 bacterium]RMF50928.1 MAG: hypothetical protein D6749_09230 [Chloroflexota bacterium]